MPSMIDSPPQKQQLPAVGDWSSLLCAAQEAVKAAPTRHAFVLPAKRPAAPYGARKKNLEMCTEALGCETGGIDAISAAEYAAVENDGAERKRRAREEEAEADSMAMQGRRPCRALPPPLTTLARGAGRVRMVHERRDGRLEVYAVRASGVEADRSGGRLRLRFLTCAGCSNAADECHLKKPEQATEEDTAKKGEAQAEDQEEEHGVAKYVRARRCVDAGVAATAVAARRGKKQWEPEQAAAFWVATS